MEKFFRDLSSAMLEFLDTYHKNVVVRILEEERYAEESERFYYTILHKINSTLYTINHAICNYHTHFHMRISMWILFRSIMLDIITAEFVTRQNESDEGRKKMIQSINADHIYRTYKTAGTTAKNIFGWSDEEVKKIQNGLRKKRPEYFDGENMIVPTINSSVYAMVNKMASKNRDPADIYYIQRAFNYYDLFSIYEHPGDLSFHLTHRAYEEEKADVEYDELWECLRVTLAFMATIPLLWDYDCKDIERLSTKVLSFTPKKFRDLN